MKTNLYLRLLLAVCGLQFQSFSFAQTNYFAGYQAGSANTTGNYNSFVGSYAGSANTTGDDNSFLGYLAGQANTEGSYNSFLGASAGFSNTTGSYNSFLGSFAGHSNTTGADNAFVSYQAGYSNTTGSANSFLGTSAGYYNTTGSYNSFLGYQAGAYNTTGSSNSFLGYRAGFSNTTGVDNAFLGYQAGYSNTTGKHNTFVGSQAGYATTTGYDNLFFGTQAGNKNITGYANAFVGFQAGYANTTGYSNTCFGAQAGSATTTAARNSFFGNFAGQNTTTGSENVFLGRSAGATNVNGYFNVSIGNFSGPSLSNLQNATTIGYRAYVSASNSLVLGSINGVNGATANTNVGIGTTAPAYLLHVNGAAAKPGSSSWTIASDERLKKDIAAFTDGLEVLTRIKPVKFRYNGKAAMPTQPEFVGVIAQQVQQIAPYMVGKFTYQDTTGKQEDYLDYDATALTYILVNAVKEVDKKYAQQLEEKDARIESLESRLNKLEQLLLKQSTVPTAEGGNGAARLWQNEPNPTDGATVIRYHIPQKTTQAQISVYSVNGQHLKSYEISERGDGQLSLATTTLPSGTYIYRLVVDGKSVDAKKLVLSK